jgi:nucleotide-binding universal stress UspA family protein
VQPAIVVPLIGPRLDPSGVSESALPLAVALAQRTAGELVLVSVLEIPPEYQALGGRLGDELKREQERWVEERRRYLAGLAGRLHDIPVRVLVRVGNVVEELHAVVRRLPRPVIVMSSHGRSGVFQRLLGSVTFRVVHEADCPVIVTRHAAPEHHTFDTLLVGLDGSAPAEHALAEALKLAGPQDLTVLLLRVVDDAEHAMHPAAERVASAYLRERAAPLAQAGWRVTCVVRRGGVAETLIAAAEEMHADLVVLGTHGRGGLGRVLFGSIAERVLHEATAPLLLVRATQAGERLPEEARSNPPA